MLEYLIPAVSGLLGALIGAFVSLINARHEKTKFQAEAEEAKANGARSLVEAAEMLVEQYQERLLQIEAVQAEKLTRLNARIERLNREIVMMRKYVYRLWEGAMALYCQVESLGGTPVFNPKSHEPPWGSNGRTL
jgi:hypothetical protein